MAEKILNTRILMKIDTLENWSTSTLKLKEGELAFATVAASAGTGLEEPVVMVKIGTAEEKTFSELPWAFHAKAADVLAACKSETALKAFVNGVIADAGIASSDAMEALAGRVTTAEGKITTLEGEMDAVEAKAAANEAAIGALETLVGDESVATQIANKIAELKLGDTYEVKGEAAKVQTALNEYKTSNDAAVQKNATDIAGEIARAKAAEEANAGAIAAIKDGTTIDSFKDVEEALAGKEAVGAAAAAEAAAKAYADGLTSNYDAKGSAAQALTDAKTYADGLAVNYDAAGAADQALVDAKAYTDAGIEEWVGDKTVGVQIQEAITGLDLANTYDAKGAAAAVESKLNTHASEAVAAYETKTDAAAKLTEAKGYTDDEVAKVQGEVDALETYVGVIPEGYTEESIIAYINKKAEETLASASGDSTETAASVKAALDTYKAENNAKVQANTDAIDAIEADYLKAADKTELQDQIDVLEGLVGTDKSVSEQIAAVTDPIDARVKAIEDDYLTSADKTELEGKITTNANAIERLTNGVSAEEVDGVNDLIQYVKDHGTEVTGIKADIKTNADAIAAIEADYLKAADKTALQDQITANDGEIAALQTAVGTKAAQADLEALDDRVEAIEGDLNTAETGLKAKMAAAEAAIEALEGKHSEGTVAEQIAAAIEVLNIGDYAKAADLTAAINQHNTDKTALEAAIALKANDADLAAIAKTGNVNDLVQTEGDVLVFDCGNASA